jgi:hypothetical protein
VIEQVLSAGVHGLMLCHARNPEAVKMFVASARYQFERPEHKGADKVIPEGLRRSGSQSYASRIWGISGIEYIERADPWPMNPKGELILSLKMEDKYALSQRRRDHEGSRHRVRRMGTRRSVDVVDRARVLEEGRDIQSGRFRHFDVEKDDVGTLPRNHLSRRVGVAAFDDGFHLLTA